MKKQIIITIALTLSAWSYGQDLHTSNLNYLNSVHNPAMCAVNNAFEIATAYRTQWSAAGTPYNALSGSFGTNIFPGKKAHEGYMSIGANVYDEHLNGMYNVTTFSGIAAYHLPVHRGGQISTAISFGYYGHTFDRDVGSWASQHNGLFFDKNAPSGELLTTYSRSAFDVGTGMVYTLAGKKRGQKFVQLGIAAHHIGRPNMSFQADGEARLPLRMAIHGSSTINLNREKYTIEPMFLFQKQRTFQSLNLGVMGFMTLKETQKTTSEFGGINTYRLGLGLFVRNADAFIVNVALQKSKWSLGMAYDFTTSALKTFNQSRGGFEIQLKYAVPSFQLQSRY